LSRGQANSRAPVFTTISHWRVPEHRLRAIEYLC
jgi:hypothetical protein